MAEPKRYKNFKVLTVTEKGKVFSKRKNKEVAQFEAVLQGVDDQASILTGDVTDPDDGVLVKDNVIEDVWVYENTYDGRTTHSLFFPSKKGEGKSGGGKGTYGKSAEELKLMRMEAMIKLIEMPLRYATDAAIANGPVTAETILEIWKPLMAATKEELATLMG